MHDAGVDHPDLNLGNLMVRSGDGGPEAFVIDLDGARLHPGPLATAKRRAALLRLERSYLKRFGGGGSGPADPALWRGWYAAGDAEMAHALAGDRLTERIALALHRLGWWLGRDATSRQNGREDGSSHRGPSVR